MELQRLGLWIRRFLTANGAVSSGPLRLLQHLRRTVATPQ